jgi:5,10-methenyltetrahydromethanopterin hydrogenase
MLKESKNTISYYFEEIERDKSGEYDEINLENFIDEIEKDEITEKFFTIPTMTYYTENFTVKELLLICEYYGFSKEMKSQKYNKKQIIEKIVSFESVADNYNIVTKRQNNWFYMNELKNDKFMKKFLLW